MVEAGSDPKEARSLLQHFLTTLQQPADEFDLDFVNEDGTADV